MKIVFMGTPAFAVPCLEALADAGHEIVGVYTQPDRPKGRGHKLQITPVKEAAMAHHLRVFQPERIKKSAAVKELHALAPELIVVVAFGQILSQEILDIPSYGCINVHASLLPKYRGAAPINWVLINGEKKTGVTTMFMEKGLDTGDMLLKSELALSEEITAPELHDLLSDMGAKTLLETISRLEQGHLTKEKQNDAESCYAPMLTKVLGRIDWTKSAAEISNLIRGLTPWPCAYTSVNGRTMKIFKASIIKRMGEQPGRLYSVDQDSFFIACGEDALKVTEIQFENEKRMSVEAYLRGHQVEVGILLGTSEE